MEKLEMHMNKSRRILNDLRSLRRLLFEERMAEPKSIVDGKTQTPLPTSPSGSPQMSPSSERSNLIA